MAVDGIAAMPELGPWPVELFAERLRLACCAAVSSTSLFSFPLRFGLPAYTMMTTTLQSQFRHPNDQMARLVVASVPPIGGAVSLSDDCREVISPATLSGVHASRSGP
jgi:hypothetical protein